MLVMVMVAVNVDKHKLSTPIDDLDHVACLLGHALIVFILFFFLLGFFILCWCRFFFFFLLWWFCLCGFWCCWC